MRTPPGPSASRSTPGGVIRLNARLTPFATRLAPAWAAVCGAIASRSFAIGSDGWLRLGLLVLLVDAGWGTLWAALGGSDWAAPIRRWRGWPIGGRVALLPYVKEGTRGDKLSRWLGRLRAWWRQDLWPEYGGMLTSMAVALPITALLAALLGPRLVLLSLAAFAVMQLGVAFSRGPGGPSPGWDAAVMVMLPWLAGHAAFDAPTLSSVALAFVLGVAFASARWATAVWGYVLLAFSHAAAAALLVAARQPVAATAVLLLLLPQAALASWLRRGYPPPAFARFARPWLIVAMAVAAIAL